MALVEVGPYIYPPHGGAGYGASLGASTIDASDEKFAVTGRVWWPGAAAGATKIIERLGWRFGNVVKAGGSGLTASLQNTSSIAGPPMQPDGTQDQTVAIANANASFASNAWIRTGTLSANRTVTIGEWLSVVIEFDGAGRLGSDSVGLSLWTNPAAIINDLGGGPALYAGSVWALGNGFGCIVLEFTDGTFGTFYAGNFPFSSVNSTTVSSTSTDYALKFRLPFDCEIDGLQYAMSFVSTAVCDMKLMDDAGSAIETVVGDVNMFSGTLANRPFTVPIPRTLLTRNTWYYVAFRPTVAANIAYYNFDVNDANHLSLHPGGIDCHYATRTTGAWTATTTKRPFFGVRVVGHHDNDLGGGGGGSNGVVSG